MATTVESSSNFAVWFGFPLVEIKVAHSTYQQAIIFNRFIYFYFI